MTLARPRHVRNHDNVMVKVMASVEIKAMNIVVMFQGYAILKILSYKGSLLVTADPGFTGAVSPDPIRIQILTKILYNKNIYTKITLKQLLIKKSLKRTSKKSF
jgi:hypothetical protein